MPEKAFNPGEKVIIDLSAGFLSQDGRTFESGLSWNFMVRTPRIAYLGRATTSPEIQVYDPKTRSISILTETGGNVTGFSVDSDGSTLIYSAKNQAGGSDLFTINGDGSGLNKVFDCGKTICREPVFNRVNGSVAFSRNIDPVTLEISRKSFPYILDPVTGTTEPVYPGTNFQAAQISWSPDGDKIAFYDANALGIRVRNTPGKNDFLLGSVYEHGGTWSPDSKMFIFIDDIVDEGFVYSRLYQLDLTTSTISEPFNDVFGQEQYAPPAFSPDGTSIVLGVRQFLGEVSSQLWIFDLAHKTRERITDEQNASHSVPQWRPDGLAIVFQKAELGSSGVKPVVAVWDKSNETIETIAEDGALPAWLP
jgi:Tol biopolymer transport system component